MALNIKKFTESNPDAIGTSNQCSLMIRSRNRQIEVPVNMHMSPEDIERIYPFLLDLAGKSITNPSIAFADSLKQGRYENLGTAELEAETSKVKRLSRLWYGEAETSLLELSVRIAADIYMRGIDEFDYIYSEKPLLDAARAVAPLSTQEADEVIREHNLESDTDKEHDPGDEQDLETGDAGSFAMDIYSSGTSTDFLSDELDRLESEENINKAFEKIVSEAGFSNMNPSEILEPVFKAQDTPPAYEPGEDVKPDVYGIDTGDSESDDEEYELVDDDEDKDADAFADWDKDAVNASDDE